MLEARMQRVRSGSGHALPPPELPAIHPSFIQVARPYMFEQTIHECIQAMGINTIREESLRLQGVSWIDNVRKVLHLPVRTYDTAAMYYHRFRLVHPDNEYNFMDAAAAALFTACKTEDTLKKSRDIVCAAYNLKLSPSEHLAPDDPVGHQSRVSHYSVRPKMNTDPDDSQIFDNNSRGIIGLERLMLEASGFDFRTRHPHKTLFKLARRYGISREVWSLAYRISLDLYRTFAPLKQSTPPLAFGCLELASRLLDQRIEALESREEYEQWHTTREEVMETLFDLLELYTHHRSSTSVGPDFPADRFLNVRIPLNQEAGENSIRRFAFWVEPPYDPRTLNEGRRKSIEQRPLHPLTPLAANGERHRADRGRDAAVRFMLDPAEAEREKSQVEPYFKVETEQYEVEE
ncbi:hypothetical protein N7520_010422 [Penicillium odoratum]|uniref:uncharacterized protein n=1 Tax=Penicillium odoratum TaxID=1167516 RepID=UPI0025495D35|nr:uncharacterized protein N7520_010422 [Penicillium odoratum]KAJ5745240.1 hypothetical protein N7520_010422 [Penicillium odoratum]